MQQQSILGEFQRLNVVPLRELIAAPSSAFGCASSCGGEAPATAAALREGFRRCFSAIERLSASVSGLSARVDRVAFEMEQLRRTRAMAMTLPPQPEVLPCTEQSQFESQWCTEED